MDANATPYDLRLGEADWGLASATGVDWDPERFSVTLEREAFRFPRPVGSRNLEPEDRRGAARDRYGNWFFIGPDRTDVRLTRAGSRRSVRYWPVADPPPEPVGEFTQCVPESSAPARLAGLAVTAHHYLLVGVPSLPGLLMFDLHGGGPPAQVPWPFAFEPSDIAAAPGDGLWILDRPQDALSTRVWRLDRNFRVVDTGGAGPQPDAPGDFGPADAAERPCVERIAPGQALEFDRTDLIAIEGLPDGSVLLLARDGTILRRRERDAFPFAFDAAALQAPPHDIAFLAAPGAPPGSVAGRLFVADAEGNQAFAFKVSEDGEQVTPTLEYYPMRLFAGRALVRAGDAVHYDIGERWLALFDRRSPRYAREGRLELDFDSGLVGCVWHRLLLDACIPPATSVRIESRSGDTQALLEAAEWTLEPVPYLRGDGSELPDARRPPAGVPAGTGTWELLFQRATGRYLQLRLGLEGNGRRTPRLAALRVYRPRFSYPREYLPDVYRQEPVSASFLERYLANPEGILTAVEGRVAEAQQHYDVRTVDPEYLPWLASWLGVVLEPDWEDARRRLFVDHLPELFRQRGTRGGLLLMIRLATDACPSAELFDDEPVCAAAAAAAFRPRIVERFLTRRASPVALGDPSQLSGPRVVVGGERWLPAHGAEALHARYREFLEALHGPIGGAVRFPPLPPADPSDWRRFVQEQLAIVYEEPAAGDVESWRRFLAARYRRPEELAAAWGRSTVSGFDELELPDELPAQGAPLLDWIQFVSIVLATDRRAHRFTVLVPIRPEDDDAERARRISRVERVVNVERPAHAAYDVRPYWAACRVGEARVGLDTVVGEGSRFSALVLGRDRLAAGYLTLRPPGDAPERLVVGRDRIQRGGTAPTEEGQP